jgi:hypothetical protein
MFRGKHNTSLGRPKMDPHLPIRSLRQIQLAELFRPQRLEEGEEARDEIK